MHRLSGFRNLRRQLRRLQRQLRLLRKKQITLNFSYFPPYVAKAAFPQGNAAFAQERLAICAGLCYNTRYIG